MDSLDMGFTRLIQSSIANSIILFNAVINTEKKISTEELVVSITKHYLEKTKLLCTNSHEASYKKYKEKVFY